MAICHTTDEKIPSTVNLTLADYVIPPKYRVTCHDDTGLPKNVTIKSHASNLYVNFVEARFRGAGPENVRNSTLFLEIWFCNTGKSLWTVNGTFLVRDVFSFIVLVRCLSICVA